jgi:cellulose synthase/poly-beta-1,6-N-acetylglucosamine synthase-like glycosyltransferase
MSSIVSALLLIIGAPAVLSSLYLLVLTLLSARPGRVRPSSRSTKFDVVVPAHNEAMVIQRIVRSLKRVDWPKQQYRILVIADNCTDATAQLAEADGAVVLQRFDVVRRGKGYALMHAFDRSLDDGFADAVLVVDADAEVSPNILDALAARIEAGADAAQVHYGILNPDDSWRTRLLTIAKASFHIVRSRARERLGLSCGIRGNGWCVTHRLLRRVPYRSVSLTEDVEYGNLLGLSGVRVHYVDEAFSNAEMVSGADNAVRQRQRWEQGRFEQVRSMTPSLLRAAVLRRDPVCLDLALDLLVLPLSYVVLNSLVFFVFAAAATAFWPALVVWLVVSLACMAAIVAYVLRGWQLSGIGWRGLADLARAPAFLLWKLVLMLRRRERVVWARTEREGS